VNRFRFDLTLVFVDLTSVYLEGQGQSPLRQYGLSKDGKCQNTQLLLAMVVTPNGHLLSHFLFPGNRAEEQAALELLVELGQRYWLQRCMLMGDWALISGLVIRALSKASDEYIPSLRARQSKTISAALAQDADRWRALDEHLFVQEAKVEGGPDRVGAGAQPREAGGRPALAGAAPGACPGGPWMGSWSAGSRDD